MQFDLSNRDRGQIIMWCRSQLGENDPFTPYKNRRWVTQGNYLLIPDEKDCVLYILRWA